MTGEADGEDRADICTGGSSTSSRTRSGRPWTRSPHEQIRRTLRHRPCDRVQRPGRFDSGPSSRAPGRRGSTAQHGQNGVRTQHMRPCRCQSQGATTLRQPRGWVYKDRRATLCARSRVDGHRLRTGLGIGQSELTHLSKAYKQLVDDGAIFIDDRPWLNITQLVAAARSLSAQRQIGLVVVDWIQTVRSEDTVVRRTGQIAMMMRDLKSLALELSIPILVLSQVSRAR